MIHHRLRGLQKGSAAPVVSDVFATSLYTGNASTQTITNGINLSGEGGLVWTKSRSTAVDHYLEDSVGGVGNGFKSNTIQGRGTGTTDATSFNSNGYSLGYIANTTNTNSTTYVSWTFRQATRFFDVVTVSHTNGAATNIDLTGLATLGLVIAKITSTNGDWIAWHRSLTASNNLRLNTTAAQTTTDAWLSVSGTTATLSASAPTGSYVVYGFAHDPDGVIQCGSYTGNGSTTGPTVTLGWEPQYLLIKNATNNSSNWIIQDTVRGIAASGPPKILYPNNTSAEGDDGESNPTVITSSTGFQVKTTSGSFNTNSSTYIYMAIKKAA